jgi:hypothetical protein
MDRYCPRCSKVTTDDRLVRCQFCGSLFNSSADEPYPLTAQQENRIYENLRRRLKLYVFGGFSILALISGVFLFDSMISVYKRGTDFLNKTVLDKVTEEFREPAIKKTVSEVASKEAKQVLVAQIQPEVSKFQQETQSSINSFKKFTENTQARYTSDYQRLARGLANVEANGRRAQSLTQGITATVSRLETAGKDAEATNRAISAELDELRRRKSVTDLGAAAIGQAGRPALIALSRIAEADTSPEIRDLATSEIMRVKGFWLSVKRTADVTLRKDNKLIKASDLKTCEVVQQAAHNPNWSVRAVLTETLGERSGRKRPRNSSGNCREGRQSRGSEGRRGSLVFTHGISVSGRLRHALPSELVARESGILQQGAGASRTVLRLTTRAGFKLEPAFQFNAACVCRRRHAEEWHQRVSL